MQNPTPEDKPSVPETSQWFGYTQLQFTFEGRSAVLIQPHHAHISGAWIWRTEFFGHEPQLDLALLEQGWHVAYLTVSDLYGAPSALMLMRRFQSHLEQQFGLASAAVLEGMSRGGLYAFNYAAAYPDKVAALYLDNPVLDIRSWPGGLMSGPGNATCWTQCLEVYGLSAEAAATFEGNPLNLIEPVAQAKIPVLLVCGDADETVPYQENGSILAERYQALGAPMGLIVKPGGLHHPHSLPDPAPLVQFLREALPSCFSPA